MKSDFDRLREEYTDVFVEIFMEDKKPKKEKTPTPQDSINIEWVEVKEVKAGEVVKKPYRPGKRFPGPQVQNEGWGEVDRKEMMK